MTRARTAIAAALVFAAASVAGPFLIVPPLGAQTLEAQEQVSPDRPSVGTGVGIEESGQVQVESGVEYARQGGAGQVGTEVVIRAGVARGLEARLAIEPVTVLTDGSTDAGFGDVTLALK